MAYIRNLQIGDHVKIRNKSYGACEVVQLDPRRYPIDEVQVSVVLRPNDDPTLLWVKLNQLLPTERHSTFI